MGGGGRNQHCLHHGERPPTWLKRHPGGERAFGGPRKASLCRRGRCEKARICNLMAPQSEGPVAQWIRHRPTELGIAGSSPAWVMLRLLPARSFFSLHRFECKTSRSMGGRFSLPLRSCRAYFAVACRKHLRAIGCCARAIPLAKRPPQRDGGRAAGNFIAAGRGTRAVAKHGPTRLGHSFCAVLPATPKSGAAVGRGKGGRLHRRAC